MSLLLPRRTLLGAFAAQVASDLFPRTARAETVSPAVIVQKGSTSLLRAEFDYEVRQNPAANVVSAPMPVLIALLQPVLGAQGPANFGAIRNFFGTDVGATAITNAFIDVYTRMAIEASSRIKFLTDSQMWVDRSVPLNPRFRPLYDEVFRVSSGAGSTFETVDFSRAEVTSQINQWVRLATEQKIPSIVNNLPPSTQYVAASALFLDAPWTVPYDPARTDRNAAFNGPGGPSTVHMLTSAARGQPASLVVKPDLSALGVDFGTAGEVAFIAVKPQNNTAEGFRQLIDRLPTIEAEVLQQAKSQVVVRMPKLAIDVTANMTEGLSNSTLGPLFAGGSNYSGFSTDIRPPSLVIKSINGKINEEGASIAAAGAVAATRGISMVPEFKLDQPYVFSIVHRATGAPIIRAIIQNPAALSRA